MRRMIPVLGWLVGAVVLVAFGTVSAAEIPPGRWWKRPRVAERLKLSEDQVQRLNEAFLKSQKKWYDFKSKLEQQRLELEMLFDRKEFDDQLVLEKFKRMENARNGMALARFEFVVAVRRILTYEQFQQLVELFDEFKRRREGGPLRRRGERSRFPGKPLPPPRPGPLGDTAP